MREQQPANSNRQPGPKREPGFKGLIAWQKAEVLGNVVFRAVKDLDPKYNWLASQVLRSAISVAANIAEGYGRGSLGDYLRFLEIAHGSLNETEHYIHFMKVNDLIRPQDAVALELARKECGRVLQGLWQATNASPKQAGTAKDRASMMAKCVAPVPWKHEPSPDLAAGCSLPVASCLFPVASCCLLVASS